MEETLKRLKIKTAISDEVKAFLKKSDGVIVGIESGKCGTMFIVSGIPAKILKMKE